MKVNEIYKIKTYMFQAFALKIILRKIQTFTPQKIFIPKIPFFS